MSSDTVASIRAQLTGPGGPFEVVTEVLDGQELKVYKDRFPNLRVASVENGSKFLDGLFGRLGVVARKMNGWFPEDPVETFRRHIWVNPFWEDQVDDVIAAVGVDRVIFGSDWPHIEALPEPLQYVDEVRHLAPEHQRAILATNAESLNQLQPV